MIILKLKEQANLVCLRKITLTQLASSDFFNKCLGGALLSLIVAAFLKRNPHADEIV